MKEKKQTKALSESSGSDSEAPAKQSEPSDDSSGSDSDARSRSPVRYSAYPLFTIINAIY